MKTSNNVNSNPSDHAGTALKVVLNLLEKWNCDTSQKQAILGMQKTTYYRALKEPLKANLSHDQLERVSYILNIHQALRMVFSNSENIYGFMQMKNNNPYFNGNSPISLITSGGFGALYEVYKRIDVMRSGQW